MYYVYLILLSDKSIYTGITTDVVRRVLEHREGKGARYTRGRKVMRVLHTEKHPNRSSASKREAEIKRWSRKKKLALTSRA
jgi:putative endonuclease